MFETLFINIATILNSVDEITKVYNHPREQMQKFPCAWFFPRTLENDFMTNEENEKGYTFRIFIFTETKVKGKPNAGSGVLARAVDAVVQKFDDEWNGGTVDGHRVWYRMSSADWGVDNTQGGQYFFAELVLTIRVATTNN